MFFNWKGKYTITHKHWLVHNTLGKFLARQRVQMHCDDALVDKYIYIYIKPDKK